MLHSPGRNILGVNLLKMILYTMFLVQSVLSANTFWIDENTPPGIKIGKLFDSDQKVLHQRTFTSLAPWPISQIFQVNTSDGTIYTKQLVDREQLCVESQYQTQIESESNERENSCNVEFQVHVATVNVSGVPENRLLDVKIFIVDINDNQPIFALRFFTIRALESSPVHAEFRLPQASDPDAGKNGIVSYKITTTNRESEGMNNTYNCAWDGASLTTQMETKQVESLGDYFKLHLITERNGRIQPVLKQIRQLDRETREAFYFCLFAFDSGSHPGVLPGKIEIVDVNDNVPRWVGLPYKVSLPECELPMLESQNFIKYPHAVASPPGLRFVLTVQAEDEDVGLNAKLTYRLGDGVTRAKYGKPQHQAIPSIVMRENKVYIASQLDYESLRKFWIPIEVVDGGGLSNFTEIEVHIEDCNDHPPSVNIIPVEYNKTFVDAGLTKISTSDVSVLWIEEEVSIRIDIATIIATDRDEMDQSRVGCRLQDVRSPKTHSVVNYFALDPSLTRQEHGVDKTKVPSLFTLYKREGIVVDREVTSSFLFNVICSDNNLIKPLESINSINIRVRDKNDNAPQFPISDLPNRAEYQYPIQTVHLMENQPIHSFVAKISATDADEGQNAQLMFRFIDPNQVTEASVLHNVIDGGSIFELNKTTGQLYTKIMLDREWNASFNVFVCVEDGGLPSLSSTVQIHIIVDDVNDCAPVFDTTPGENGNIVFYLNESIGTNLIYGRMVGEVHAEDADDVGPYKSIRYEYVENSLRPANIGVKYRVNTQGRIYADGLLDREQHEEHHFQIRAIDGGMVSEQRHTTMATIIIRLLDLNDSPPRFLKPSLLSSSQSNAIPSDVVNVSVEMPPGSVLYEIIAMDPDTTVHTHFQFSMRSAKFLMEFFILRSVETSISATDSNPIAKTELILLKSLSNLFPTKQFVQNNSSSLQINSMQFMEYFLYIIVNDSLKEPCHSSTARLKIHVIYEHKTSSVTMKNRYFHSDVSAAETDSLKSSPSVHMLRQQASLTENNPLNNDYLEHTVAPPSSSLSLIFVLAIVMICIFLGVFCFAAFLYLRRLHNTPPSSSTSPEHRDKKAGQIQSLSAMGDSVCEKGCEWECLNMNGLPKGSSPRPPYNTLEGERISATEAIKMNSNEIRSTFGRGVYDVDQYPVWSCVPQSNDNRARFKMNCEMRQTGMQCTPPDTLHNFGLQESIFGPKPNEEREPNYHCVWASPHVLVAHGLETRGTESEEPCHFTCEHSSSSNTSTFRVSPPNELSQLLAIRIKADGNGHCCLDKSGKEHVIESSLDKMVPKEAKTLYDA